MKKLLCKLFGHRYIFIRAWANERSVIGYLYCIRCEHEKKIQFDN
ncbi:hypothetical protein KA005_17190 [bacterium]|nr:hypothetical protein [bacterium]